MKKRTFNLDCNNGVGTAMSEVLYTYADTAYPKGGSPCSMATREALETMASQISTADNIDVSTRQRPMLRSAVKWFYEETEQTKDPMFTRLTEALTKKPPSKD